MHIYIGVSATGLGAPAEPTESYLDMLVIIIFLILHPISSSLLYTWALEYNVLQAI